MQSELPLTFAYLKKFEEPLRKRSGFRQFFKPDVDPFYSIYNVGQYTFSRFKVCWREQAQFLTCAVAETAKVADEEKVIVPDHKLMFVPLERQDEAHYVCAVLNSPITVFVVKSYAVETQTSTHVLEYVRVPRFDPREKLHTQLAESSEACHAATASGIDSALRSHERANNALAAELWKLPNAELKEIESSLADLR
jgi:hypothetical protein